MNRNQSVRECALRETRRRRDTIGSRAIRRFQRIVSVADFRDLEYYSQVRDASEYYELLLLCAAVSECMANARHAHCPAVVGA